MWIQCRRVINRKRLLERESESTLEIKTTYRSDLKYIHQVQECVWVWAEFIGVYYLRTPLLNANIKERSEKSRGTWLPRQDFVCKVFYSKHGDYNIHILLLGPEIVTTDSKATPMLLTVSRMTIIWLARLGFIWELNITPFSCIWEKPPGCECQYLIRSSWTMNTIRFRSMLILSWQSRDVSYGWTSVRICMEVGEIASTWS